MAENKQSFILYTDLIHTVNKLTNEQAGILFKHILSYVNDQDLQAPDFITEIVFEPIKQALKRDLIRWHEIGEIKSEAGRRGGIKSGEARKQKKQNEANEADASLLEANEANEHVSVSVIVSDKKEKELGQKVAAADAAAQRKKVFNESLIPFLASHPKDRITAFFNYWSELNKSKTKMRYENERTWETELRLKTWAGREKMNPKVKIDESIYSTPEKW